MIRRLYTLLPAVLFALPLGCNTGSRPAPATQPGRQAIPVDPRRHNEAVELDRKGVKLLDANDAAGAEKAFKAAIEADASYGPGHSNLGSLYFRQGKYYLASWEFEYAAKLMPAKAAPLNNLGLVYERVGRLEDAAKALEKAMQREGETMQVRGNLARVYIAQGKRDERTGKLLETIAREDTRPAWREWAKNAVLTLEGKPVPPPATLPAKPAKPGKPGMTTQPANKPG